MASPLSRRAFLAGFGGGAASIAGVWALWVQRPWSPADGRHSLPDCCDYVDYGGWILTKADKDRLTAAGSIRVLESTVLEGRGLADQVVPNVESCSVWCLGEPDCQGFTFAKPSHPDPNLQNRCWLKNTSELTPKPDPRFTSGLR